MSNIVPAVPGVCTLEFHVIVVPDQCVFGSALEAEALRCFHRINPPIHL